MDPFCRGASLRYSPYCKQLQKSTETGFYLPEELSEELAGLPLLDTNWQCALTHFERLLTSVLLIIALFAHLPELSHPLPSSSPVTITLHRCWLSPHRSQGWGHGGDMPHSLHLYVPPCCHRGSHVPQSQCPARCCLCLSDSQALLQSIWWIIIS